MTQEYSRIVTALFMAPTGPPRGGNGTDPSPHPTGPMQHALRASRDRPLSPNP